ncbi:hypothetical protein DVS28_b0278 (plasmid) [Euzebya pacifica]|uniref:Uncharacterized protein n=1 Tax=Euzebya pacifica TaxID=1608957 RepID=A0A346Y6F1_9ACTN|nr:hypothetical protein [Euzebya pacifica]AXV10048.1 hypothetical protein DVS28_b0278 [Euzebya pacifica]
MITDTAISSAAARLAVALIFSVVPGPFGFIASVAAVIYALKLIKRSLAAIGSAPAVGGLCTLAAGAAGMTAFSAVVGTGPLLLPLLATSAAWVTGRPRTAATTASV